MLRNTHIVALVALVTMVIGCGGSADSDGETSSSALTQSLIIARTFSDGEKYKAYEPVFFRVKNAGGREDVHVRFTNGDGTSVRQAAILYGNQDEYIVAINPALAAISENWIIEIEVGEETGEVGTIGIDALPSIPDNIAPGQITIAVLESFVGGLKNDISELESQLLLSEVPTIDQSSILQMSQDLLQIQENNLLEFRLLVESGVPIVNESGQTLYDRDSLHMIDRSYLALLEQYTSAVFNVERTSKSTILTSNLAEIKGFGEELLDSFYSSTWEASGAVGETVGTALAVTGILAAAAGATAVGPPLAVAGVFTYAVSTFAPAVMTTLVNVSGNRLLGNAPSKDDLMEVIRNVARRTCSYAVGLGGSTACSAVERTAEISNELVSLLDDTKDEFNISHNEIDNVDGITADPVEPLVSGVTEICASNFGSVACDTYNNDFDFLFSSLQQCAELARTRSDNLPICHELDRSIFIKQCALDERPSILVKIDTSRVTTPGTQVGALDDGLETLQATIEYCPTTLKMYGEWIVRSNASLFGSYPLEISTSTIVNNGTSVLSYSIPIEVNVTEFGVAPGTPMDVSLTVTDREFDSGLEYTTGDLVETDHATIWTR